MKSYKIYFILIYLCLIGSAVSAQTIDLININFGTACGAPPIGWNIENIDGSCTWRCSDGGITQNNHSSQSCANAANDWLISPALNLDAYRNEALNFTTTTQYSGGGLAVKYSTNYPGTGNPNNYTWVTLSSAVTAGTLNFSLSSLVGDSVYIAFQYTSAGNATNQAARWTITNVRVSGERNVTIENPSVRNINSTTAIIGAEVTNDGGLTIAERGVVWSVNNNPTLLTTNTTKVISAGGMGVFDTLASGLPAGTLIYYRGYARTATQDFYSPVASFYTLATKPTQHVTSFTATAISSNAIKLNWNTEPTAKGYLILQRVGKPAQSLPDNATAYAENQQLADATIVGVIEPGTIGVDTIFNLLAGTRYYYTLVPFSYNATRQVATFNYKTDTVIPVATDSTLGVPTSIQSDLIGIINSESAGISSIINTLTINANTDGVSVWKLALRDGGLALNDADLLPTSVSEITLIPSSYNTANWSSMIQSVAFFDDSTGMKIGNAQVVGNTIKCNGLTFKAADNNMHTLSVRISLNKLVALPEETVFQFSVTDTSVKCQSAVFSSQFTTFAAHSSAAKNKIQVTATQLRVAVQPPTSIEAGVPFSGVTIEVTDVWNNVDVDSTLTISISSIHENLYQNVNASTQLGKAVFNDLRCIGAIAVDTFVFNAGLLLPTKSARVKVKNSGLSDLIATPGFVYQQSIPYINYLDTVNLTPGNSVALFGLRLRDGGANLMDADTVSTQITSLTLQLANYEFVQTLALFDSLGNNLAEQKVNASTVSFSNVNCSASDNKSHSLMVRATFKKQVTDGVQPQLKVISLVALGDTLVSQFAASNGGGATSTLVPFENRLNVVATKLAISASPQVAFVQESISPSITVNAIDSLGNIDLAARVISASFTKGTADVRSKMQQALSPINGVAEFSTLVFMDTTTATQIIFSDSLLSVQTAPFDVNTSVWYRTVKSGNWEDTTVWEYSLNKGSTWLPNPLVAPNGIKHGSILISKSHTISILGNSDFAIDETTVDTGAVLITPSLPGKQLVVLNGNQIDVTVYGKLIHANTSVSGMQLLSNAQIKIMPTGVLELSANGYASNWAANSQIQFANGATYYHKSLQSNSIPAANYFSSSSAQDIPVFRVGVNTEFRGNALDSLTINGLVQVDADKIFTISGSSLNDFKNGFSGDGQTNFTEQTINQVSDVALLSGNGRLSVKDQARLMFTETSVVSLINNKQILTPNNTTVWFKGKLITQLNSLFGNGIIGMDSAAWLVTAHPQGVRGALATNLEPKLHKACNIEFNGQQLQYANVGTASEIASLEVSNLYGVNVSQSLRVTNTLDLAKGSLTVLSNGLLQLSNQTTIINYNTERFIKGKVRVDFEREKVIPIGVNNTYAPVKLMAQQPDTNRFDIEYINTTSSVPTLSGTLVKHLTGESWSVNRISGTTPVAIELAHHAQLSGTETLADLRVALHQNNQLKSVGPELRIATSSTIKSNYISQFGVFSLAVDQACTLPSSPIAVGDTICWGTSASITAQGAANFSWYTTPQADDKISDQATLVTGSLFNDTTLYVASKNLSCVSVLIPVKVKVVAPLSTPQVQTNFIQTCSNTSFPLIADGKNVQWYANEALTMLMANGDSIAIQVNRDTIFYTVSTEFGCVSPKAKVDIVLKSKPVSPRVNQAEVCLGNDVLLAASTNVGSIKWFVSSTQKDEIATATSLLIKQPLSDTVLYAATYVNGCLSEKVAVGAKVNRLPELPVINSAAFTCAGSSINLRALSADTIKWFTSDLDTLPVFIGSNYTTPVLHRSSLYFVRSSNGKCISSTVSLPVTVIANPTINNLYIDENVRQFDSTQLSVQANGAELYEWYFGADAQPAVALGAGPHWVKWTTSGKHPIKLIAKQVAGLFACEKIMDTAIWVTPNTGLIQLQETLVSRVYPNPAQQQFTVEFKNTTNQNVNIMLLNSVGQLVWSDELNLSQSKQHVVNVEGFTQGIYLLMVECSGERIVQKLVIGN